MPLITINEVDAENYKSRSRAREKESPKAKLSSIMEIDDYNKFELEQPGKSQFFGKSRLELEEASEDWNLSPKCRKIQDLRFEENKNDLNISDNEESNLGSYRSNVNNIDTGRGFLP